MNIIIAIILIFLFLAIYLYILNYQSGQSVKVIENIHLPDISFQVLDYKTSDRCFNPGIFHYNSEIYYVYRIHIGGDFFYGTRLRSEISHKYPSKNVIYNPENKKHWLIDTSEIVALKGFEDPRAIVLKNKLYLVVNEMNKITRFREMYLIIIDLSKLSSNIIKPKKIIKLQYDKAELRDQKNWMPLIFADTLYFIYSLRPYILLSCDANGKCTEIMNIITDVPKGMRGSSNIIKTYFPKFGEIHLGITHSRFGYAYVHRFFALKNLQIIAISPEFLIQDQELLFVDSWTLTCFKLTGMIQRRIQFIAGLLQIDNILYITYGEGDYYAKQFKIGVSEVENILKNKKK